MAALMILTGSALAGSIEVSCADGAACGEGAVARVMPVAFEDGAIEQVCEPRGAQRWSCPTLDDPSSTWSISVSNGLRAVRIEASPGDALVVELPALESEVCLARPTSEATDCVAALRTEEGVLYLGTVGWDEPVPIPQAAGACGRVTVACAANSFHGKVTLDELAGDATCVEVEAAATGRVCASSACRLRSPDPVLGLMWAHRPKWVGACTRELPPGDYVLSCPDGEVIGGTQMWSTTQVALASGQTLRYDGP